MSTIWHNPACGTSRNALAILRAAGESPEVIEYLKTGWTAKALREIFRAAGLSAREALRERGSRAEELGLTLPGIREETIIAAMVADPALVNRPFVRTAKGVRLCRPVAMVADLLPRLPDAPVLAADGRVIFDPATAGSAAAAGSGLAGADPAGADPARKGGRS